MNIQSGINQTLSIASLLMSQTPLAEQARESAKRDIDIKRAKEDWEVKKQAAEKVLSTPGANYKTKEPAFSAATEAGKAYYNLAPSAELHQEITSFEAERSKKLEAAERRRERRRERKAQEEEQRIASSNRTAIVLEGIKDEAAIAKYKERLRDRNE